MNTYAYFGKSIHRRRLLASTAIFFLGVAQGRASVIRGEMPWSPNAGNPPVPAGPGPWLFFTGAEGRAMEALADRIIPPDSQTPGGKDAGFAVFIDRKSTRLNSSHQIISYAVFCFKKKNEKYQPHQKNHK